MDEGEERRYHYRRKRDKEIDVAQALLEQRVTRMETHLQDEYSRLLQRLSAIESRLISERQEDVAAFRAFLVEESKQRSDWRQWRMEQVRKLLSGALFFAGGLILMLLGLGLYEWVQRKVPHLLPPTGESRPGGIAGVMMMHPLMSMRDFFVRHWRRAPKAVWWVITGAASGLVLMWYGTNLLFPPLIIDGPPVPIYQEVPEGGVVQIRYIVHKIRETSGLVGRHLTCVVSGRHDMPSFASFMKGGEIDVIHEFRLPEKIKAGDTCRYSIWVDYQNDLFGGRVTNPITLRVPMQDVTISVTDRVGNMSE